MATVESSSSSSRSQAQVLAGQVADYAAKKLDAKQLAANLGAYVKAGGVPADVRIAIDDLGDKSLQLALNKVIARDKFLQGHFTDLNDGGRMAELGLVNRLADPGKVLDVAVELAERIVANAPLSIEVSKEIILQSPDWSTEEEFARQTDLAGRAVMSEDAQEGILAFAEKRAPKWSGR